MTDDVIADDGSIADIPWASVFDPDHNVRAFNAIQERGFRAASAVIERLVGAAQREPAGSSEATPEPKVVEVPPEGDVQRAMTAWQSILAQAVGGPRTAGATPAGAIVMDLNTDGQRQVAYLEAGPGATGSVEVWLHNGAAAAMEPIVLRCSDLLSHDGEVLKSTVVHLDPECMEMPGRCSRGVLVSVEVAIDVPPGRYRGTLLADGHPDVWLPVVLTVVAPADA